MPADAPVVDRVLGDKTLREQLVARGYPVSVARGFMSRAAAVERTLATLRFFWNSLHGPEPEATGFHGFYYHLLDMQTGRRAWQCEFSTVDTAFLLAGALTAAMYFGLATADEQEIRTLLPTRSTDASTGHGRNTTEQR